MSRLYETASEGRWSHLVCLRCAGANQRVKPAHESADCRERYWWANAMDEVCGLCRCEIDAEEQAESDYRRAMDERDEGGAS